ncbi:hypothetical protein [Streptomyces sp. NPDC059092]|uniref:hypothetical protein n=1 Tax=Streptomyces sp. NPDC059092 TaxID=3346725 RepID=UPI0036ABBF07
MPVRVPAAGRHSGLTDTPAHGTARWPGIRWSAAFPGQVIAGSFVVDTKLPA